MVEYIDVISYQQNSPIFKVRKSVIIEMLEALGEYKNKKSLQDSLDNYFNSEIQNPFKQFASEIRVSSQPSSLFRNQDQAESDELNETMYEMDDEQFISLMSIYQKHLKNQRINIMLALWNVMGDISGYKKYSYFQFSVGESLHCEIRDIHVVKALIKDKYGCYGLARIFPNLFRFLNIEYIEIPMVSNSPLPNWLGYQYHHDLIEMRGFWDEQEDDELMIRIESRNQIIMREFILKRLRKTDPDNDKKKLTYNQNFDKLIHNIKKKKSNSKKGLLNKEKQVSIVQLSYDIDKQNSTMKI
ncbi:hypothetical protein PPERSA_09144 [Pseudocohnilembus persalinus]|uniref:Uncharacterized protein n=1 Tax=Pseudocohnilembus persalinus TaxID=266149 RepID=A0A0V0QX07_PSEPJ|nr:hypothetical protein PPERSA_09144 [Pseudocohnilembus persalinus]|eukprot:KRX06742.1 hypothetical protein PPERSA_09144 [Pseudocohnilembus persalinus]